VGPDVAVSAVELHAVSWSIKAVAFRLAAALLLVLPALACSNSDASEPPGQVTDSQEPTKAATDRARERCPVTPPNDRPLPGLFGNGSLAAPTYFPAITVAPRHIQPDGWIGEKFPWRAYGITGDLQISGRRIDGSAKPLRARINPGYPVDKNVDAFWAVAILFPTPGCWRITGSVGLAALTFVTRVVDPHGYAKRKP